MSDVKPVAWQRFDEIGEYDSYMGSVEEGDYVKYDDALTTVTALQAEIEAMRKDRERISEEAHDAYFSDTENGVKWLNEEAAKRFKADYPEISAFVGRCMALDAAIAKEKQQESLK